MVGQIEIDLQLVLGICGHDEPFRRQGQQVVFPHDARHSFVVDQHALAP